MDNLDIKKNFYSSLNERQQRHFLGLAANELGHGGILLVSQAFGVDRNRVSRGLQEVKSGEKLPDGRIRKKGGGRKKKL